jgi:hypothetical protein
METGVNFSNEKERGEFVTNTTFSLLQEMSEGRLPLPTVVVIDATTSKAPPGTEVVIPVVSPYREVANFERDARKNGDEEGVAQVRAAMKKFPGQRYVYLMHDGGSSVSVMPKRDGHSATN